ncbi:hypothetical protein CEXT_201241 [Caerostris extrusa]|uniref:Uncharacterized protein n=1 Tax=Caerostris extrusa TaxID=172846 RepID=A0AAV4NEL8_CAEEX|nr:hypothetical protein CEXT_201241 [Caerostris extrusa]
MATNFCAQEEGTTHLTGGSSSLPWVLLNLTFFYLSSPAIHCCNDSHPPRYITLLGLILHGKQGHSSTANPYYGCLAVVNIPRKMPYTVSKLSVFNEENFKQQSLFYLSAKSITCDGVAAQSRRCWSLEEFHIPGRCSN